MPTLTDATEAPRIVRAVPLIAGACVVMVLGGVASYPIRGAPLQEVFDAWVFQNAPVGLVSVVLFGLALRRQPRNRAAWCFFIGGIFASVHVATMGTAYALAARDPALWAAMVGGTQPIRDVPGSVMAPLWVAVWAWLSAATLPMIFGLLLFPDGRLPSPRWRPVAWLGAVGLVLASSAFAWAYRPWSPSAVTLDGLPVDDRVATVLFAAGSPLLAAAGFATIASLVARMRRADPDERRRVRPVMITGSLVVAVMVLLYPWPTVWASATIPAIALLLVAVAASVARHRLFDVELVVSRAVTTAVLGVGVTLAYVAIVVTLGELLGTGSDLVSSVAATAVIAVAFEPVRRRVLAVATRLVLGARATPYEVLSQLSDRLSRADSTDEVLTRVVQLLVDATGATRAEVRTLEEVGDGLVAAAGATTPDGRGVCSAPVVNGGELLGEVRLLAPRQDRLQPSDERLLREVAATLGPVLRNTRLTRQLHGHIEELRTSRGRLVAAHDEARRSLERDIHDGAQQQLLSMRLKLGLAATVAEEDGADRTAQLVESIAADADAAIRQLRDLARGLYPPILAEQGLEAALRAQARDVPLTVTVRASGLGRHDRGVEAAVYFCCLEAVHNAVKHADASTLDIHLAEGEGTLRFAVTDDGSGFDPAAVERGAGLTNMADRLEGLGGSLRIEPSHGGGTVIQGEVPTTAPSRQPAVSER